MNDLADGVFSSHQAPAGTGFLTFAANRFALHGTVLVGASFLAFLLGYLGPEQDFGCFFP